ncbi:MAG TPA: PEGA domain-containing protein [Blastocatellia bacterium]|nr:PEGA domain-containing protein [Blastocatellia bacterium]
MLSKLIKTLSNGPGFLARYRSNRTGIGALFVLILAGSGWLVACSNSNETSGKSAAPTPKPTVSPSPASVDKPSTPVTPTVGTTGTIEVRSTPPGAAVMLLSRAEDSVGAPEPKGTTPAMITGVTPGKYMVDVEMNGYRYYQKEIDVKVGATVRVSATLKKQ